MKPRSSGILLLHRGAALLPSFGPDLQVAAAETLEKQGIEVVTNASVTEVESDTVSCLEILSIYIYIYYTVYIYIYITRQIFWTIWIHLVDESRAIKYEHLGDGWPATPA